MQLPQSLAAAITLQFSSAIIFLCNFQTTYLSTENEVLKKPPLPQTDLSELLQHNQSEYLHISHHPSIAVPLSPLTLCGVPCFRWKTETQGKDKWHAQGPTVNLLRRDNEAKVCSSWTRNAMAGSPNVSKRIHKQKVGLKAARKRKMTTNRKDLHSLIHRTLVTVSNRQHLTCNFHFYVSITIKLFPVVPVSKQAHLDSKHFQMQTCCPPKTKSKWTLKKERKMWLQ